LMYVEHSPDSWYSDNSTDGPIEEAKAKEIVAFLQKRFNLST